MSQSSENQPGGELVLYQTEDGTTRVECRFDQETVWLSLNQIAELFDRDKSTISRHIKNIFEEGELTPQATVAKYATVQEEGSRQVSREVEYFNLDVIISVGYRVKSHRGTQFRIWATQRLREYLVKGFLLDDERFKQGKSGGYFDELLARIRDIRSSEKEFWRKVLDIYSTSVDYDPSAEASLQFFATVQNKMHWAVHGQTAAEIIHRRADATQKHLGLTSFPKGQASPRKADITIAKNYLSSEELDQLNRIVNLYLEFAELQAINRKPMKMTDWIAKLDQFLQISDRDILTHAGSISAEAAKLKAEAEYEKYRKLDLPTPVEKHFMEAVDQVKQIEEKQNKPGKKRAKK